MKSVEFISKRKAESIIDPDRRDERVVISITTPGTPKKSTGYCCKAILHDPSWKDILRLEFHDTDPKKKGAKNQEEDIQVLKLFSESQAVEIMNFLKIHENDIDTVVVHCEAGISRSGAVAKFIAYLYGLRFPETYQLYNNHVFSTLLKVYGESLHSCGLIPKENLPALKEQT